MHGVRVRKKAIVSGDWIDESKAFANIQLICENSALKFKFREAYEKKFIRCSF